MQWLPDLGIGYLDVEVPPDLYGAEYFAHYQELDDTNLGHKLTDARIALVLRHWHGAIVDVGIGGGYFLTSYLGDVAPASGWDVNPEAIKWLFDRGLLCDPRDQNVAALTMWDVIEHMREPAEVLDNVSEWVFLSTPVYENGEQALASKHYKPGEHLWYFTERGVVNFMRLHGFTVMEANRMESDLGRESIASYAFRRT